MTRGKSIRIYLADGSVTGIRHAEIVNWTGQGIACPRKKVSDLSTWQEATSPGVYFLLGRGGQTEKPIGYIGEAENVFKRLQKHLSKKDFWNEVIFFTNKDENLTKSHVKFLESKLILLAHVSNRYVLDNGNKPQEPLLPRADRDAMFEFMNNIRLLLGTLGHKILEPLTTKASTLAPTILEKIKNVDQALEIEMAHKEIKAQGMQTNEGIVVLKGSLALKSIKESLSPGYKKLKETLIKDSTLTSSGAYLSFTEDCLFSSPSAAAAIIVGHAMNGRIAWKTKSGKTIKDLEEKTEDVS